MEQMVHDPKLNTGDDPGSSRRSRRHPVSEDGWSLSAQRRAFDARRRRRAVLGLIGVLVLAAVVPVVGRVLDRVDAARPGAQVGDLDVLVEVVEDAQERLLAGAVDGPRPDVDYALDTVSSLQAVVDGARAGYVEGGADPGLVRLARVLDASGERVGMATEWAGRHGSEPRGLWARCQARSREPAGTRERTKDALRTCAQHRDMSTSSWHAWTQGDIEEYLDVITGSYPTYYRLTYEAASGR
jgi:hypothetical protein